ncbi:unnamed protein product [Prorocentrum cordatum]|uniref:Tubulin--tyrosine ligase-like protein 9 n=1 Tax=Prorocentrum cordatum TaxID=2364126 RepID=A0ABN9T1R0_9DINO|nr:unnamed protein product [Polarella glacialis]
MAQKYIENPLIVRGKKFDIRQWVVVTRWQPLAVWFYNDCYLRFSFSDYDPSKIKNKYAHLTNNSISKKAKGFDDRVDETMWHSDEFCEFLKTIGFSKDGHPVEDPWAEVVQPAMKRVVMTTMQCAQDVVQPRTNSFELFGYDFMVDDDLGVWLIEVNSSPDLSYSTSTTEGLVKAMLEDMMRVVVDVEKFGVRPDRPRRKWGSCRTASGRYELLEPRHPPHREGFRRVAKDTGTLAVQGCAVQLRRPRRGECPRGPDVEDDPRYSAASLLAAAGVEEGAGPEGGGGGPEAGDSDSASSEG